MHRPVGAHYDRLRHHYHPILARVYAARAVSSEQDLDHRLAKLAPFCELTQIERAVARIWQALASNESILIAADFDADGATGCAVAVRGLRMLGAERVDYIVPNRFEFGYGLTPELVEVAAQRRPDLIITVDNGISSVSGIAAAQTRGIDVIVTDHHLPGEVIPQAYAIVNPNQPGDGFPSKSLAGVGVMFYVLIALRAMMRESGEFKHRPEPKLGELLDLVCLGTVADLVPFDHNNRILVAQGLARIRSACAQPGLLALLKIAGRDNKRITASDLAYTVAPRLNAAGRLADMALGIECLLAQNEDRALELASRLDKLNGERKEIEADMHQDALTQLEGLVLDSEILPMGLCLYDEHWHQGVIGILASRVKERYRRPVVVFARSSSSIGASSTDDGFAERPELKGSARSVDGVHIRDGLSVIDARYPGLIRKFGGHAMAAGLTIASEHLDRFKVAFEEEIQRQIVEAGLCDEIVTDGSLEAGDLCLDTARMLRSAGPWGKGFPEPVFDGEFDVLETRTVGGRHLKLKLRALGADTGRPLDAMAFNAAEGWPRDLKRARIAYRLDVNRYLGLESVALLVEHLCVA